MKEYNYFIDTNVFLRTLLRDEETKFKDCFNFLSGIKKKKLRAFTSNLVLAEINWTLLRFYKFPKSKVIKGLYSILNLKHLKFFDKFNPSLAMQIYKSYPVKFIDALIASDPRIQNKNIIVVSYDKDFGKLKVIRKEPRDIIKKH